MRQFKIDAKGAVVSRGDSFRRKRHAQATNSGGSDSSNNRGINSIFFSNAAKFHIAL